MKKLILTALIVLVAASGAVASDTGSTILTFLKFGVGGRASAMGDAYMAVSNDATAMYWNPAGMVDVGGSDVVLMHDERFQDIRHEYAGFVHDMGKQAFGVGVIGNYVDGLEKRESATAVPISEFAVFDFAFSAGYARELVEGFSVGATAKYLYSKIDDVSATGFAGDIGILYHTELEGFSLAGGVQNLGTKMKYESEDEDLPFSGKIGFAYEKAVEQLAGTVLVVADVKFPNDDDVKVHGGLEYGYKDLFAARVGYRGEYDNKNISVGAGFKVNQYRIDYAFVPFYSDLGNTHRVSLGVSF
jgi:hypothetical protein